MALLSRDQILEADDLETREVAVPEWGGEVIVKALSGEERDAFELSLKQIRGDKMEPNLANARAKLVARCIVDEDGTRLFSNSDIKALGKKSAAALERVFEVAAELSGLQDGDVEEMVKNSEAAQSGDSTSTSPENSDSQSEIF